MISQYTKETISREVETAVDEFTGGFRNEKIDKKLEEIKDVAEKGVTDIMKKENVSESEALRIVLNTLKVSKVIVAMKSMRAMKPEKEHGINLN